MQQVNIHGVVARREINNGPATQLNLTTPLHIGNGIKCNDNRILPKVRKMKRRMQLTKGEYNPNPTHKRGILKNHRRDVAESQLWCGE